MRNEINNVGDFFGDLLSRIAASIPEVLGASLILLVGYIVAKFLGKVTKELLEKANLDKQLHDGQGGNVLQKAVPSPSGLVSKVVFWLIFLFAISAAVGALGIPLLTSILEGIYAYIPNVIAALLIFLVAGTVSGAVAGLVQKTMGDTATGKIVRTVAPVVIMGIAGFMILNQLMIAPAIVTITYAALLGSAGLGLALAFGLGGRETAGKVISDAYDKGQDARRQAKKDVEVGKERVQQKAKSSRQRFVL